MTPNSRACIAYTTACLSGNNASSVYDHSQSRYINISGTINQTTINIYDHDRNCHIIGTSSSLYDYGNSAHIQLSLNGSQFTGYDYHTSSHFNGSINGHSVSIYDYETSTHYNHSI